MIQNNTGPSALNNNKIVGTLDFRNVLSPYTDLAGLIVGVGTRGYTIGTNWLPKFSNPKEIVPPEELANSLVEAINGTYDNSPSLYGILTSDYNANHLAEAYAKGSVVTICSRGEGYVDIVSVVPGLSTNPSGVPANTSLFLVDTALTGFVGLPGSQCHSFDVENLSTTNTIFLSNDSFGGSNFSLAPLMGTTLLGDTSKYSIAASATSSYQIKLNYK